MSPWMHNAMYQALGLEYEYVAIRVPIVDFAPAIDRLKALGYRGVNVTVPLKTVARDWCLEFDGPARSANTLDLEKRRGTNTDAPAFLKTLAAFSEGKRALILGAGGTAAALIPALVRAGYQVSAWNRTEGRLKGVVQDLGLAHLVSVEPIPCAVGFDVVINTTSAGLGGQSPPVLWAGSTAAAYDVGYQKDGLTPFLSQAAAHGARTQDGKAMLVEQGALAFEWWTGHNALRNAMTEALSCP